MWDPPASERSIQWDDSISLSRRCERHGNGGCRGCGLRKIRKKERFERRKFWLSKRTESNGRARLSEKHGVFELGCLILKCAKRHGEMLHSRPCEEEIGKKTKSEEVRNSNGWRGGEGGTRLGEHHQEEHLLHDVRVSRVGGGRVGAAEDLGSTYASEPVAGIVGRAKSWAYLASQSWLTSNVGSRIFRGSERERARESLLGRISHLLEALRSLSSAERGHSLPVAVSGGVGGGGGGRGGGNISILR